MVKRIIFITLITFLILVSLSFVVYSKIFNKNQIVQEFNRINYYDYVYKEINKNLELELPNSELSYLYFNYLTISQVKKDINVVLDSYLSKKDNDVKTKFYNNIINNFENKNDAYVKELAKRLSNTYYSGLFSFDKLDKFIEKLPYRNISKKVAIVSLFITILIILLSIKKDLIDISISFITSGIIFIIPKIFIHFKNILLNFYYYNKSLSYFIKNYIFHLINIFFKIGFILMILGLIGFTIHYIRHFRLTSSVK